VLTNWKVQIASYNELVVSKPFHSLSTELYRSLIRIFLENLIHWNWSEVMLIQSISMESIVYFSAILMIITAIITFLVLLVIAAPYGKFTENKGWGPLVNAKIAWFVMESPNLISSYTLYSLYKNSDTFKFTNKILLLTFAIHYIHRTLIYPLRMHGANANPMPLSVMMLAFLFTSWNSFNQATYLTLIANYP
jgi:hypothetical protein